MTVSTNPSVANGYTDLSGSQVAAGATGVAGVTSGGDLLGQEGVYAHWRRSSALACMVPSSGSVAANGALTLTTAVPTSGGYTWGCYMYFPANAVYSSSVAGLYFVVMSSTTLGTIYDNRLAADSPPSVPTTLVPIVAAGPGAYTQTTSPVDLTTITLPANMLGANGWMLCAPTWAFPNNANNKVISLVLGSSNIYAKTRTTATQEMPLIDIRNRGVVNRQFAGWGSSGTPGTASTAGFTNSSVDTSAATNVIVRGQLAVATDYIILESLSLTAFPFP
jgi:hypothetical protein